MSVERGICGTIFQATVYNADHVTFKYKYVYGEEREISMDEDAGTGGTWSAVLQPGSATATGAGHDLTVTWTISAANVTATVVSATQSSNAYDCEPPG